MKEVTRIKLNKIIWEHIQKTRSVLDIGCGLEPQRFFKADRHICCEPCPAYADVLTSKLKHKDIHQYIQTTAQGIVNVMPPKSVDSVFLLDVIEHLTKTDGANVIIKLEQIARKQIILRIPLGLCPNDYHGEKDCWGYYENGWQKHRSTWWPENFDSSWKIIICPHYTYILGDGSIHIPAYGTFFAIKNLDKGDSIKLSWLRQFTVTTYDCIIIAVAYLLNPLPPHISKWLIRFAMRTVWRRVGV